MADHIKYALVEYATNKAFCNVYDALGIERLEWEVVSYDRERRIHLDRGNAYLPIIKAKLLIHHVLMGSARQHGWKLEVFGGSFREDSIESRLFKVEFDPGSDNKFSRFPWRVSITIGPGKKTATGGIAPNGKPTTSIAMRFPDDDFTGICLEIRDFLSAHQRDLEQVRRTAQQKRFTDRQTSPLIPNHEDPIDWDTLEAQETVSSIAPENVICHIGTVTRGKRLGELQVEHLAHIATVWKPRADDSAGTALQIAAKQVLQRTANQTKTMLHH